MDSPSEITTRFLDSSKSLFISGINSVSPSLHFIIYVRKNVDHEVYQSFIYK